MESFAHTSVLQAEAMHFVAPRAGAVYCDGTLGGGGHAEHILAASAPDGRLIGVDRDPSALAAAAARLAPYAARTTLVHGRFGALREILDGLGVAAVDGLLLDVGVSSPQLDQAPRGFSFQSDGPLDMRMDPTSGVTARELCEQLSEEELRRILRDYGEERFARAVARAIKEALAGGGLHSTAELAQLCLRAVPTRERGRHPATRTFQALRIVVNDELGELARVLEALPSLLRPGGRVVIISFHSLEDGLVKRRLRELTSPPDLPPEVAARLGDALAPDFRLLTRKPVSPSDAEVEANPRARSAKLRAAERSPARSAA